MAYHYTTTQGKNFLLHARVSQLRDGGQRKLYYFAPKPRLSDRPGGHASVLEKLPKGYQVRETRHGLPVVKPVAGAF